MKILIWFSFILVYSLITSALMLDGIRLGGIPTFIFVFITFWAAKTLCRKWDEHIESQKLNNEYIPKRHDEKNTNDKINFCRKCGEVLIDNSSFCRKCGTEIIENISNVQKFKVIIYDENIGGVYNEIRTINIQKFPPSRFAYDNTYYAIEKLKDGKRVRVFYTKENWEKQIENYKLTAIDTGDDS